MRSSPARLMLIACGLLILTNGPVFLVANRVLDNGQSWEEPLTRAIFISVAVTAVAAVVLDRYRLDGARLAAPNPVAAAAVVWFSAWAVLSSFWSLTPELTRGRSLIYVGLAAFAWVVSDLEFRDLRRAILAAMTVAVVASLLLVAFSQSIGIDRNDDWRGVFTNRNSLAPVSAIAIILGASLVLDLRGRPRVAATLIPMLGAVAMAGSGSRTAWLALLVAAGAACLVVGARIGGDHYGRGARTAIIATGAGAGVITIAMIWRLWNETTFVQRRTIWGFVWERIGERPLHGFGWFNVWADPEFISLDRLLARGSAHGSFFEVWLGLGLIGLIPFLIVVGLALHGAVTAAWRRPSADTWAWLALVSFLIMENLTESFVLWFSYNWVLLMVAALRSDFARRRPTARQTPVATEPANV